MLELANAPAPTQGLPSGYHVQTILQLPLQAPSPLLPPDHPVPSSSDLPPAQTPSCLAPHTTFELLHLPLNVPRSLSKENKTNRVHFLCKTNGNKLKLNTQSESLCFCPKKCNKGYPSTTRSQKIKPDLFPGPTVYGKMSPLCSRTHRRVRQHSQHSSNAELTLLLALLTARLHCLLSSH